MNARISKTPTPVPDEAEAQNKRKTCKRYNVPGAHALTFSCYRQQPFLNRDRSRRWFLDALAAARVAHAFDLWAYVIMPEHVHLVIMPHAADYSIPDILRDLKRPVAREALKYVRAYAPDFLQQMCDEQPGGALRHRFWQRGGGYDRNLTKPETIRQTIEYVHANPVGRGLAETPEAWYWSSAAYYVDGRDVPLVPDAASIPPIDETIRWNMAALRLAMPPTSRPFHPPLPDSVALRRTHRETGVACPSPPKAGAGMCRKWLIAPVEPRIVTLLEQRSTSAHGGAALGHATHSSPMPPSRATLHARHAAPRESQLPAYRTPPRRSCFSVQQNVTV